MTSIPKATTDEITRSKTCLDPYLDPEYDPGCFLPGCLNLAKAQAHNSTQSEASSKIPMYGGCYFMRLRLNEYDACPLLQGAFPDELPVVRVCRVEHHLVETSVYKTDGETCSIVFICDAEGHVIAAYCCVFNYDFARMLLSRNDGLSTMELRSLPVHANMAFDAWSELQYYHP